MDAINIVLLAIVLIILLIAIFAFFTYIFLGIFWHPAGAQAVKTLERQKKKRGK